MSAGALNILHNLQMFILRSRRSGAPVQPVGDGTKDLEKLFVHKRSIASSVLWLPRHLKTSSLQTGKVLNLTLNPVLGIPWQHLQILVRLLCDKASRIVCDYRSVQKQQQWEQV